MIAINSYLDDAKIFKAFCDETRLMVLSLLQDGEKCACELLNRVSVGQSTLSHHMKILLESGIVIARKEGKWMYYYISQKGSETAIARLYQLTAMAVSKNECETECESENKRECCAWVKNLIASRIAGVVSET